MGWHKMKLYMELIQAALWRATLFGPKADNLHGVEAVIDKASAEEDLTFKAKKPTKAMRMNLMGRVSLFSSLTAVPIAEIDDITFYLDGSKEKALQSDFLRPAWLLPVLPSAQATCEVSVNEITVELPEVGNKKSKKGSGKGKAAKAASKGEEAIKKVKVKLHYINLKKEHAGKQEIALSRHTLGNYDSPFRTLA